MVGHYPTIKLIGARPSLGHGVPKDPRAFTAMPKGNAVPSVLQHLSVNYPGQEVR